MRILSFALLLATTFFMISCGGGANKNTTVNGYNIERYLDSKGAKPAPGDLAFVHLYAYMDGNLQTSTRQQGRVMPVKVYSDEELTQMKETGKPNPVYEAIAVMSVGDSLKIDVPITEEMRQDPRMAETKELYYVIAMESSKTEAEFKAEQEEERAKMAKLAEESKARLGEIETTVNDLAKQYTSGSLKDELNSTESGLKYMILEEGDGPATKVGSPVNVHYYGTLTNGEMFDNSFQRGQAFNFPLGQGRVIKGWDEGVALLKTGDKAVLFIPSELGYGAAGAGEKIPGDSELIFYIEVL